MSEMFKRNRAAKAARDAIAAVSAIRLLPHIALLLQSPHREVIWKDLDRYAESYDRPKPDSAVSRVLLFVEMMTFMPEYRNVFYFRHRILGRLLAPLCPPVSSLRIFAGSCGPGLFVHHGFGTMVTAEKIGANFTVRQLATVGFVNNAVDCPTIGDNVTIGAGARVLGRVKIGDDVVVGANTVVIADVPSGATVIGVPSKVVSRRVPGNEGSTDLAVGPVRDASAPRT